MYYFYILLLSNGNIYKGYTSDLKQRFKDHCKGKVKSTRNYLPVKLLHYEAYLEKGDAMRRERFIKTTEGKRILRQQIKLLLEKINKSRKDG